MRSPRGLRTAARILLGLVAGAFVFAVGYLLILTAASLWDAIPHTVQLQRYASAFRRMEHPANTTLVASRHRVGLITGNGNHCDYFVGELRRYDGDLGSLTTFYATRTVAGNRVSVMSLDQGEFPESATWVLPYRHDVLGGWTDASPSSLGPLYLVFMLDGGHSPGLDVRCH